MKSLTPTEMLASLARIDSPSGNETAFFDFVSGILCEMKFTVEYDDYGNMVAHRSQQQNKTPILFAFHGDKVSNGKSIEAILEDGYIVSHGMNSLGADNKAAIACLICVLQKRDYKDAIEILITKMEEEGFIGARNFDRSMIRAEVGITMDGGKVGEITIGSKYWTSIAIKNEKTLKEIEESIKSWAIRNDYSIWFNISNCNCYNIEINILTKHNIIDDIVNEILKLTNSCEYKVTRKCPGFNIPVDHEIVELVISCIKKSGIEPKVIIDEIAPEVCVLNSKTLKCINIGDGVINEHELNEKVLILDLEKNCTIINNILDKYMHRTIAST